MQEPDIVFEHFAVRYPRIGFFFTVGGQRVVKYIDCDAIPVEKFESCDPHVLDNILGHIGLAFLPTLVTPDFHAAIEVQAIRPTAEGQELTALLLGAGLGEWRLANRLPLDVPIEVSYSQSAPAPAPASAAQSGTKDGLVLNGGGKDSVVAGEVLTRVGKSFTWLTFNRTDNMRRVIGVSGNENHLDLSYGTLRNRGIRRSNMIGHRPHCSLLSFMSLLPAHLLGYQDIVLSNEASSSEANIVHQGIEVNHQYSKSAAFEQKFSDYVSKHILRDVRYYSLLRPLNELQIAKLFSAFDGYHKHFMSCNVGHRRDGRWCGKCPKCAFIYLALACFMDAGRLKQVFPAELFEVPAILDWLVRLADNGPKPFECVGTKDECRMGLSVAAAKHPGSVFDAARRILSDEQAIRLPALTPSALLQEVRRPHRIPSDIARPVLNFFSQALTATAAGV